MEIKIIAILSHQQGIDTAYFPCRYMVKSATHIMTE